MDIKLIAAEIDALRQGMDWDETDINRKQIMIETSYGDSHPGSIHLNRLAKYIDDGVKYSLAKPSHFTVTDICDGIAQGHEGMNYSLVSREIISFMTQIHYKANNFDGIVAVSSCDKSIPAHLMALATVNAPAIFVPGGVMPMAGNLFTLEQIGRVAAEFKKGEIDSCTLKKYQMDACTSCGACQFMGTAGTMQVLAESLGLALPHSALMPANTKYIDRMAKNAGKKIIELVEKNIRVKDILTKKAFHNAVVMHGAIGGSTNSLLHIPAIAHKAEVGFDIDIFDKIHREVPFMVNTRPSGKYSTDLFWYAGGVPYLMMQLKKHLHLDVLTVTGKTLGENLEEIEKSGILDVALSYLANFKLKREDLIYEISPRGAIAILRGNIAQKGAVVKYTGLPENMTYFKGRAKVFKDELSARNAILEKRIVRGDIIVIAFVGPRGSGMPEMFYTTEALCADKELIDSTAIITDGRFSGASRGPCIGHISPEAAEGGNIGLLKDGDKIIIDIDNRRIDAVNIDFEKRKKDQIYADVTDKGILGFYKKNAVSAIDGGYME